jgi:hypothetical protein
MKLTIDIKVLRTDPEGHEISERELTRKEVAEFIRIIDDTLGDRLPEIVLKETKEWTENYAYKTETKNPDPLTDIWLKGTWWFG